MLTKNNVIFLALFMPEIVYNVWEIHAPLCLEEFILVVVGKGILQMIPMWQNAAFIILK